MKAILILTTVSGFLEKFEKGNLEILQEMGYSVHYAANMNEQHYLFDKDKLREQGVWLHHIDIARSPFMLNYNIRAFFQLMSIIRRYDIQAIHCHTPVGGMLGRLMGIKFWRRGLKVIYTAHGFHFYKGAPMINNTLYYLVEKLLAHFTDFLIVINKEDYANGKKLRLKKNGRVFRIPGVGLDTGLFSPLGKEERRRGRERLGITPEDFYIVAVGELNENKNQKIILEALDMMRRNGEDISKIKVGICGDGFFKRRLQKQIAQMKLQDNVFLYGYCMDVPSILGCADISMFPSIREGLGMAGLEALAMEIPLLASENRGTREYLKPGMNGYFCKADNTNDWVKGIKKFLDMPEQELMEKRKFCRKSVLMFSKENTMAIMRIVYNELDKLLENADCRKS